MNKIRRFIASAWRQLYGLLFLGIAACTPSLSENDTTPRPLYEMPDDALAEVARYAYTRQQHGLSTTGTATLIIVREHINKQSYAKTQKLKQRMPVIKIVLTKTLPGINCDLRDNLAMYSRTDLRPVRLAVAAEDWCGNNYLEWIVRGDEVTLLGRPYTDDLGRVTSQEAVKAGYYLYEQLPVLVRALAANTQSLTVRMIAPQSAYLLPHVDELQVELQRRGIERIKTAAGEFSTIVVTVKSAGASEYFPYEERYWLDEQWHFIVKAERNEVGVEAGKAHVTLATYELQNVRRMPYWLMAAPPATNALSDRQRATHSSWLQLNRSMKLADGQGPKFRYQDAEKIIQQEHAPAEYLSDPRGNNRVVKAFDGGGGWWFNEKTGGFELNYRTEPPQLVTSN